MIQILASLPSLPEFSRAESKQQKQTAKASERSGFLCVSVCPCVFVPTTSTNFAGIGIV